ncbi:hypothetical protein [Blastococcus sp. SYSU D01042]
MACAVGASAVLAGCSAEQQARETLPSVSSAAPSEEELPPLGPAEFPVPDEAREKTPEGALAFAEYYMALGVEIGEGAVPAAVLLDLSTDECRLCGQVARSFIDDQAAGYTYSGSKTTFTAIGLPRVQANQAELGFLFTQSAYVVLDQTGQEVPDRAGQATGNLQSGMLLTWNQDLESWLVSNLTVG